MSTLTTARLRLEPYRDEHADGLHAMNSDPEVMRYLSGKPDTPDETRAIVERVKARWREVGYSWWAFVERDSGEIVGAGCLQNLRREATALPDLDCPLEIGWRLRRDAQGRGYASEAAVAIGDFAFDVRQAPEIYAVCDPANAASARVMQRLGMSDLGLQHWYGKEVTTYRIDAAQWHAKAAARRTQP